VYLPEVLTMDGHPFAGCAALEEVSLPKARTIGQGAFQDCNALKTVSLPVAQTIGNWAFENCALKTVILGSTAPTLGPEIFLTIFNSITVTVKVPSGATGYGTVPGTYTGSDTTGNWGNAFRGMGWDGTSYGAGYPNSNITLSIEEITP
jgi:hypothetical protein